MNIFVLHQDPDIAAQYHCDKHVNKMIVESAQMLSTAIRLRHGKPSGPHYVMKKLGKKLEAKLNPNWYLLPSDLIWHGYDYPVVMKKQVYSTAYPNHPCTVWTRQSISNWMWLYDLLHALNKEWRFRFRHKRNHASFEIVSRYFVPAPRTSPV